MRMPEKLPGDWMSAIEDPETAAAFFKSLTRTDVQDLIRKANDAYLPWDKLRFQAMPEGVSPKQAWAAVALSRLSQFQPLALSFIGRPLKYWIPPQHQQWLSTIDQKAGGSIGLRTARSIPDDNERYLYNSLMEEAIASSLIEGAVATREVAKEMLRTRRQPRDVAEQMIVNNFKAILEIRDLKNEDLTPALLRHFQETLTDGTLEKASSSGRFRTGDEDIRIVDDRTGEVIFTPPSAGTIDERIKELCSFANGASKPFIHPVIKAIALHFAVGFIHPFVDGNGRTARAVFYWYMLRSGYWLFEYLPISRIIVNSPAKYARAYLHTEHDGGDLTYFTNYNLRVIIEAIDDLHSYFEKKHQEAERAEELLNRFPLLNLRQRLLIQDARAGEPAGGVGDKSRTQNREQNRHYGDLGIRLPDAP